MTEKNAYNYSMEYSGSGMVMRKSNALYSAGFRLIEDVLNYGYLQVDWRSHQMCSYLQTDNGIIEDDEPDEVLFDVKSVL